jgi:phosphoribosylanthranilate isomerase
MPGGPGVITDELIRKISLRVPPAISTFLLTSETSAREIIRHCKFCATKTVQLVDEPEPGTYQEIREALPYIKIVQVIHMIDEGSVKHALSVSQQVDALLLDSGNPDLKVKVLGGTGKVHNWDLSRRIVRQCKVPVFLAGGITPDNVRSAIDKVMPYGIDLCSGIRSGGVLDEQKLRHLMNQAGVISEKM